MSRPQDAQALHDQPRPASDVVPGKVHCAKCGFTLLRTNLYVNSGTTGPGGEETEPCPNDGNPMLPVTWEHEAREAWATCEKFFDRAIAAEAALTQSAPQAIPQDAESRQAPVRVLSEDDWLDLASRHANADWNAAKPDGYLEAVKALVTDALASIHPSSESEGSEKT